MRNFPQIYKQMPMFSDQEPKGRTDLEHVDSKLSVWKHPIDNVTSGKKIFFSTKIEFN